MSTTTIRLSHQSVPRRFHSQHHPHSTRLHFVHEMPVGGGYFRILNNLMIYVIILLMSDVFREIIQEELQAAQSMAVLYDGMSQMSYEKMTQGLDDSELQMMDRDNFDTQRVIAAQESARAQARVAVAELLLLGKPIVSDESHI